MNFSVSRSVASTSQQVVNWITGSSFEDVFAAIEEYAIVIIDQVGTVATWNTGAERVFGYQAEEIIGRNIKLFYSIEDKNHRRPEVTLMNALKRGKTFDEGWRLKKDGSLRWASLSLSAIKDNNKQVIGFILVARDLTDRKIIEDHQSNKVEEFRQRNAELTRSEDQYHKMIAEVQDYAIILLDPAGNILDWNLGAENIKKYKSSEIVGRNFRIFYSPEDKAANLPERLLHEAETKGRVNHEGWRVRKDGTRFWGSVSITALHGDNNELIGFSKVTRDLTERKKTEDRLANTTEELRGLNEELRRSEEQYHRMVAEVRDYAIILLDIDGNILNWNAGAEHIKGYRPDEILGKNFRVFYTDEDRVARLPERLLNEAHSAGRTTHEGWRIRKDGTRFWGNVVITALHDEADQVVGYSKVVRDLTDKKKSEDELKESAAKLQMTNQELASFTHVASHDLKEPLRKIRMFISQLENIEVPDKVSTILGKVGAGAQNMQNLIDDLLSYSLIANEKVELVPVDLNAIVRGAMSDVEASIAATRATIEIGPLPNVAGVAFQLRRVFQNLFSNAIKFSQPGLPPLISVHSEMVTGAPHQLENKSFYKISVSDNGVGFSNEDTLYIFDPFARLPATKAIPGTGIGLAIVKKVIENFGGSVTAEGKPGKGATINLYMPAIH